MKKKPRKPEKILPTIKLKYFKHDSAEPVTNNEVCAWCSKTNIKIGGGLDAHTDNPKVICEDCAIDRFQREEGFKSREAAAARRRRMFDVVYLMYEMVLDAYLKLQQRVFDELSEEETSELLEFSQFVYNDAFSRAQKEKLEEFVHQGTIERHLRDVVTSLDLESLWGKEAGDDNELLFDDCSLCQMMKHAMAQDRSLTLDELHAGFKQLHEKNDKDMSGHRAKEL